MICQVSKISHKKITMFVIMTIKEKYKHYSALLKTIYNDGEAIAIANIIFEHFVKMNKSDLLLRGKETLSNEELSSLNIALAKLLTHEPVQYITNEAWFYNLKFYVTNDVLIPRPETEELVHEAIAFLKTKNGKSVLDIGTGSGCIPISIKKNIPNTDVMAIDVSEAALTVAKENALTNNVEINLKKINFLEENNYAAFESFDVIISNPPYIPEDEKNILDKNVTQYEPHIALFVPQNDALIFYKRIVSFAENHLKKDGRIFLETHENLAKETAAIFVEKKYFVEIKKDMQGKERMLIIYRYPTQ
jgi:release factor glutamine methyltransferase